MEKHGEGQLAVGLASQSSSEEGIDARAESCLETFRDRIDSPMVQLILRNAIETLMELPEDEFSLGNLYLLLQDDSYRARVVQTLAERTPEAWSQGWDSMWRKDGEPLLSKTQQQAARRLSLITFWRKEWGGLPADTKARVAEIVRATWVG